MPPILEQGLRKVLYNLYCFFLKLKNDMESVEYHTDANIWNIVTKMAGISDRALSRIIKEGQAKTGTSGDATLYVRPKKRETLDINSLELGELRRIIYRIYTVEQEIPRVCKIMIASKECGILNGRSVQFLGKLVHSIGFSLKENSKNHTRLLIERFDLIESRFDYLKAMHKYRSEKRNIIFVGEAEFKPIRYADDVVKGPLLVVMLAGSRTGLVDGVGEIITSSENYSMTPETFHNWVNQKLKDKLPPNSVVVIGSETYHCVQIRKTLTVANLITELQDWLRQRNIHFAQDMSKIELLKIINSIPSRKTYKVNEILQGHTVLHVPPFHTDLNPMRLVLSDLKKDMIKELIATVDEKTVALNRLFSEYTAEKFQKHDDYVCAIEKEYWNYDMKMDDAMDKIILRLRAATTSADSGSSAASDEYCINT